MKNKFFVYQVFPRWFGNSNSTNKENGTIDENGVGKFSAFDAKALKEIQKMGFTHIWFTGVLEHATKTDYSRYGIRRDNLNVVKGNAGSPYAIKDYYDVCPDLADNVEDRIKEFEALIERTHKYGMQAIIDFVPNHTARQYNSDKKPEKVTDIGADDDQTSAFAADNNYYYIPGQKLVLQFPMQEGDVAYNEFPAKATGNDCFNNSPTINDWYETAKLNYGIDYNNDKVTHFIPIPDLWYKLRDILLYWVSKGVDGFRCDMAEMVPVEFWNWLIPLIKRKKKSVIFIAEIYKPEQYHNYIHAGFDYLYDKVGLYDTLRDVICANKPTSEITFCWQRLNGLEPKMLNFLENHDEQRIASDFFASDPFKAIPGMIVSATMNTCPVMIYAGQELGERGMDKEGFSGLDGRTTIFDYWSIGSIRNWRNDGKFGISKLTKDQANLRKQYIQLLQICNSENAIMEGSFYDLMYINYDNQAFDSTKIYAFLRAYKKECILVLANFSGETQNTTVNIPDEAYAYIQVNPEKIKSAIDLISGKEINIDNERINSIKTDLKPYSGKIIKFSFI